MIDNNWTDMGKFLDILEKKETELLGWGLVDGGFSEDEIFEMAKDFLEYNPSIDLTDDELVNKMIEEKQIFDLNINGRTIYRTRMAEAVRLFARLRQLFSDRAWEISPTLVTDFRFALRPRTYPRRHIKSNQLIEELTEAKLIDSKTQKTLESLLSRSGNEELLLSNFQSRATKTMLKDLKSSHSKGMIICAGTGTGKTLAFYLPALSYLSRLISNNSYWTKAVALYPRNELLKDQFSDIYREARRLDSYLTNNSQRKLIIGAYFGPTPKRSVIDLISKQWKRENLGYVCPFIRCPSCEDMMIWLDCDIESKTERLRCRNPKCKETVESDEIILTRERMKSTPPDILFTTTEMLNRIICNQEYGHIFGVRTSHTPKIVLLDEVHTYSGIHGAQVANVIRRWKSALGKKVHFTGLSATLMDAANFFSQLTGIDPDKIEEIDVGTDLVQEGMEYMLALRGDPFSGTSLLSTTIQSAMLLRRVLDPRGAPSEKSFYGKRIFLFTDDLDVTNRLFHDLLDAEGLNSWGRPIPGKNPLAQIRSRQEPNQNERMKQGQSWYLCEEIDPGGELSIPLRITRTSSQDIGVDIESDIIVTTASLEVGFNDPDLGGIIQHKAPRNSASFLQRKGRAGRSMKMRPWTLVVLSDYGRDKLAYQGYDLLFDPTIRHLSLPISNRYVLRIQAAYTLMEWLTNIISKKTHLPSGNIWNDLSGPSNDRSFERNKSQRQAWIAEFIKEILNNSKTDSLTKHLESALQISQQEALSLMWDPPRSLMMGVLPTLLRRLETGWRKIPINNEESALDYIVKHLPLPDFIPANLFSDLNLPEVRIIIPPQTKNSEPLESFLSIFHGLKEFTPGRVSRRFGTEHRFASHWIKPLDLDSQYQKLPVNEITCLYEELGEFQVDIRGKIKNIRCVRPWEMHPEKIPQEISPTSKAMLNWNTQITPFGEGIVFYTPKNTDWIQIVKEIRFYIHNRQTYIRVRRFATSSSAEIRKQKGDTIELSIEFTDEEMDSPVGIGLSQNVDGIAIRYVIPDDYKIDFQGDGCEKIRSLRTAYFKHRVINNETIGNYANIFIRERLCEIFLSTLCKKALFSRANLTESAQKLFDSDLSKEMEEVLKVIFQTIPEDSEELLFGEESSDKNRVQEKILEVCGEAEVAKTLEELSSVLWSEPDKDFKNWLFNRIRSSLGGAFLSACQQICPEFESGDLILDIDSGVKAPDEEKIDDGLEEIWITESVIGGGGTIEEILRRYTANPTHFFKLAESSLSPSDYEIVDNELTRLLEYGCSDPIIKKGFADIRNSINYQEMSSFSKSLKKYLHSIGFLLIHPVMTAINLRLLKPGTSEATDRLLLRLVNLWKNEEKRLGIEIDSRVFSFIVSTNIEFFKELKLLFSNNCVNNPSWCFQAVYGLLWPRGNMIYSSSLNSYNQFAILPESDRRILLDIINTARTVVKITDTNYFERSKEVLRQEGMVWIQAPLGYEKHLKHSILKFASTPIDVGFIYLFPQLEGIRRDKNGYYAQLQIREALY